MTLALDPNRDYQPGAGGDAVHYAPRHLSTMTRDITMRAWDSNPQALAGDGFQVMSTAS